MENTQTAGDPVNTATGSLTETFRDLTLTAPGRVVPWDRASNSLDSLSGAFGPGWTFRYGASVAVPPDGTVTFRDGSGGQSRFSPTAGGGYAPADAAVTATLTARADGGFVVRSQACNDFEFDSEGRLVVERDAEGRAVTLTYDGTGRLATITDAARQALAVTWGTVAAAEGRITAVTASDGRRVAYGYETTAGAARLTSVTAVDGAVTRYAYDSATGLLSGITDPAARRARSIRTTRPPSA